MSVVIALWTQQPVAFSIDDNVLISYCRIFLQAGPTHFNLFILSTITDKSTQHFPLIPQRWRPLPPHRQKLAFEQCPRSSGFSEAAGRCPSSPFRHKFLVVCLTNNWISRQEVGDIDGLIGKVSSELSRCIRHFELDYPQRLRRCLGCW